MDDAEHAALRFVNSIEDDGKTRTQNSFSDVTGLLQHLNMPELLGAHATALPDLLAFRESLFGVLSASAAETRADAQAEATVKRAVSVALSRVDVLVTPNGLTLSSGANSTQIDVMALAAYDLMTSDDFARLSECHRCTRLFIDRGRGKGRRWCDMARCGNRAKAESYRARKRAEGAAVR